mgnify:CR=1 FL=1
MTTIVNTPPSSNESGESMGMVVGLIVLIVMAFLFFFYGLPAIKSMGSTQVNIPASQINVPSKIDVNVTQPK